MHRHLSLILLAWCSVAHSADYYILAGGTGSFNGTSWANAAKYLVTNLVYGTTYWIGDGDYSAVAQYWPANPSGSGTVTIKKATVASHGTSTGWVDTYGDGVAQLPMIQLIYPNQHNITIDGGEPYGFLVNVPEGGYGINISQYGHNNITLTNIEVSGPAGPSGITFGSGNSTPTVRFATGPHTNITVTHCRLHGGTDSIMLINSYTVVVEYCEMYDNVDLNPVNHNNVIYCNGVTGCNFRYNKIWNSNDQGLFLDTGASSGWKIYGNIWHDFLAGNNPCIAAGSSSAFYIYNNTFSAVPWFCINMPNAVGELRNNIFQDCTNGVLYVGTSSNNYTNSSPGNPFVDMAGDDYHITSNAVPRDAGYTLSAEYSVDMDGNLRGDDGTWDIGAYEYTTNAPTVASPSFDNPTGTYTNTVTVTVTCATAGATIHYTTDGSIPDSGDTAYSVPLTFTTTTTLRAIGVKDGYTDSDITTAVYTITNDVDQVSTPAFDKATGTYTNTVTVTITCATAGATIYYTTDGSTPDAEDTAYTVPLTFTSTTTLKAIGIKDDYTDSAVASAVYTIVSDGEPPAPTISTGTITTIQCGDLIMRK